MIDASGLRIKRELVVEALLPGTRLNRSFVKRLPTLLFEGFLPAWSLVDTPSGRSVAALRQTIKFTPATILEARRNALGRDNRRMAFTGGSHHRALLNRKSLATAHGGGGPRRTMVTSTPFAPRQSMTTSTAGGAPPCPSKVTERSRVTFFEAPADDHGDSVASLPNALSAPALPVSASEPAIQSLDSFLGCRMPPKTFCTPPSASQSFLSRPLVRRANSAPSAGEVRATLDMMPRIADLQTVDSFLYGGLSRDASPVRTLGRGVRNGQHMEGTPSTMRGKPSDGCELM